jgi:hypothetical protein
MLNIKKKTIDFKIDKINIMFLIVFLALVGIYFLSQQPANNPDKKKIKLSNLEQIDKIEMINNNSSITLVKEKENWFVSTSEGQQEANLDLVDGLMEILSAEIELEKISDKEEKYGLYELDDQQISYLKLYKKDKLIQEWGVGKMGPVYPSTFIKLTNDPNIYQANNFLTFLVRSSDWVKPEEDSLDMEVELEVENIPEI